MDGNMTDPQLTPPSRPKQKAKKAPAPSRASESEGIPVSVVFLLLVLVGGIGFFWQQYLSREQLSNVEDTVVSQLADLKTELSKLQAQQEEEKKSEITLSEEADGTRVVIDPADLARAAFEMRFPTAWGKMKVSRDVLDEAEPSYVLARYFFFSIASPERSVYITILQNDLFPEDIIPQFMPLVDELYVYHWTYAPPCDDEGKTCVDMRAAVTAELTEIGKTMAFVGDHALAVAEPAGVDGSEASR